MSDAQFNVFYKNVDKTFDYVIVGDISTPRSVKTRWFKENGNWGGAEIGPLSDNDENYGIDTATICIDGSRVQQTGYSERQEDCFGSSFVASGTLNDAGTVQITVNQG